MKHLNVLWGLLIIFTCLFIGEIIVHFTSLTLPSSIIGMLCLCGALHFKWIRLAWVQTVSTFLIRNMALFFVPPGVGLMIHFDLIKNELFAILSACIISTLLVLVISGWTHQYLRNNKKRNAQ
jgi:holin-like protein